tara:strand:+ start:712 stop:1191 length:480 start_codon:yes stop_codon:yes gene_type:complete
MAKVIFDKISGGIYRIAKDQAFLDDNKNFRESEYDILDITTEEFNDVQKEIKIVVSHNNSTVTLETINYSLIADPGNPTGIKPARYETAEQLNGYKQELIDKFKFYLRFNSHKPLATNIASYITVLEELNTSSLTPLNMSLEQYLSDQGHSIIHPLEVL